ncbi:MAG: serine/threonine protein phosphatase [Rhodospirillaceae bacterium]|jgi:serine/threonine protein phosphatase 1|nr:serine/threonine protein phosphatase [Rhodospirillaceae bacterium]MBT6116542.1 serine/threonine protein phosphatase [Rhodospirillaceae bacterium]
MFGRLFGRNSAQAAPAALPPDTRIYAVGDIHGRADLLREAHDLIRADMARAPVGRTVVIYLGDYVDRGLESRQVIDLLLDEPLEGVERIHLKGNHEQFMLLFLDDQGVGGNWLSNGGNATLYSYGVGMGEASSMEERMTAAQATLREAVPQRHLAFLRDLRLSHREGDYIFVHAGVKPGRLLEEQVEEDLLWIRDEFLHCDRDLGGIVVHGHSIAAEPEIRANRIGIDTGAFASGVLTVLVLEGTGRGFLQTE